MIKTLVALSTVAVLTGCSDGMVGCNDSGVKSRILDLLYDEGGYGKTRLAEKGLGKSDFYIESIVTKEKDESTGHHKCTANYATDYKGKTAVTAFEYKLTYIEDKDETNIDIKRHGRVINYLSSELR